MEKETLISELKTRLGETPLSDRTITEYAGAILSTVPDGDVPDTFWDMHKTILSSMGGQLRADNKAGIDKFKADWDKDHKDPPTPPTPPTPPAPPTPPTPPKGDNLDEIRKLLEEQNKSHAKQMEELRKLYDEGQTKFNDLQKRYDEEKLAAQQAATKKAITEALQKNGEVNNRVLELALSQVDLKGGETIEKLTESTKAIYEKEFKAFYGEGATPFKGQGANDPNDSETKKYLDELKKRNEAEATKRAEQRKTLK
jgi:hypothetical protein